MRVVSVFLALLCVSCVSADVSHKPSTMPSVSPDTFQLTSDNQLQVASAEKIWARELYLFRHATSVTSTHKYIAAQQQLDSVQPEDMCNIDYAELVDEMLRYNKSSLVANYIKFNCAERAGKSDLAEKYLDDMSGILQALLLEGDGINIDRPIQIRELSEAYIILQLAGYEVVNVDVLLTGDKFVYRALCREQSSGQFEFRYLANFHLLRVVFDAKKNGLSDGQLLTNILSLYIRERFDSVLYAHTRYLIAQRHYNEAEQILAQLPSDDPYRLALQASLELQRGTPDAIEPILTSLISLHEAGYPAASAVLAYWLLLQNETSAAAEESQSLLSDIAPGASLHVHYQYLFEFILLSDNYETLISRFLAANPSQNHLSALHHIAKTLEIAGDASNQRKFVHLTQILVSHNFTAALYDMGWLMLKGKFGVKQDDSAGLTMLQRAATSGYADAMLDLGWFTSSGQYGVAVNKEKAVEIYQQAANLGSAIAKRNLAVFHRNGVVLSNDHNKAAELLEASASQGVAEAYCLLGNLHHRWLESSDYNLIERLYWFGILGNDGNESSAIECQYGLAELNRFIYKNGEQAKYWYVKAGENGSENAYHNLALMYENGELLDVDVDAAIAAYEKATQLGHANAPANLGFIYETGELVEKDMAKAAELYQLSSERQGDMGMNNLATFYLRGIVMPQNKNKALGLYVAASEAGNSLASMNLGHLYAAGDGVEVNHEKACDYFERAMQQSRGAAFVYVARCYAHGKGRTYNFKQAYTHFEKALEHGNRSALEELAALLMTHFDIAPDHQQIIDVLKQHKSDTDIDVDSYLGHFYFFGFDSKRYFDIAKRFYEQSMSLGNVAAFNNLGEMYRWGYGVEVDLQKSLVLYRKAVEFKSGHAAFNLSELYEAGEGVEQDQTQAFIWAKLSAEWGLVDGMFRLAEFYRTGNGTDSDIVLANHWYQQAAERGFTEAMYYWGINLLEGIGVTSDTSLGLHFLRKAANNGSEQAESYLSRYKTLTRSING